MKLASHLALTLVTIIAIGCKKKPAENAPTAGSAAGSALGSAGSSGGSDTGSGAGSAIGSGTGSDMGAGSGSDMGSGAGAAGGSNTGSAGSAAAGSGAAVKTGFARFDDALAGTQPWITAEEAKAGIVELIVDEDLSGKTKPVQSTKRLCGAPATKAAEQVGGAVAKRAGSKDHDAPTCTSDGDSTDCIAPGLAEGDVSYLLAYRREAATRDGWMLVGVQSVGVGIKDDKQQAEFTKLLAQKCK